MAKRYNRFKPSELSDRMMNLNRIEDKNLENKIRQIEKETRVSLNSINREIKHLENEHQIQQKLVNGLNNSAKIKFLNAHLHMAILQNRKLENDMKKFAMDDEEIKQETTKELVTLPKINNLKSNTIDSQQQRAQSAKPSLINIIGEQTEIIPLKEKDRSPIEKSNIRSSKISKDPLVFFEKRLKETRKSLTIDELPHLILEIGLSNSTDSKASCFTHNNGLMNITVN